MGSERSGQPPASEHGPVRPVHTCSGVGAAQDGDFVAQDEELDVLGGRRATQEQDQPEHLPENQVEQPQRHAGIMSDQRSSLVSNPGPTSVVYRLRRGHYVAVASSGPAQPLRLTEPFPVGLDLAELAAATRPSK